MANILFFGITLEIIQFASFFLMPCLQLYSLTTCIISENDRNWKSKDRKLSLCTRINFHFSINWCFFFFSPRSPSQIRYTTEDSSAATADLTEFVPRNNS